MILISNIEIDRRMGLLNRFKVVGGFVFALGCILMWVSFFGLDLIYSWIPNQIKIGITYLLPSKILPFFSHHLPRFFSNPVYSWGIGAKVSILGFLVFFGTWIISKIRSKYGFRYRDRKGLNTAKKIGIMYFLTIVFWIISIIFLKTEASHIILENSWPQWWITGFLLTLVSIGFYMSKIRPVKISLLNTGKSVLVLIFIILIIVGGFIWLTNGEDVPSVTTDEVLNNPNDYVGKNVKIKAYYYDGIISSERQDFDVDPIQHFYQWLNIYSSLDPTGQSLQEKTDIILYPNVEYIFFGKIVKTKLGGKVFLAIKVSEVRKT